MSTGERSKGAGKDNTSKKGHEGAQKSTRPARDLSASDWVLLRYLVMQDGLSFSAAGRRMNVKPSTIRMRCTREKWRLQNGPDALPGLGTVIVQRNDHQMLCALTVMDGTLQAAMREDDPARLSLALQKAEMIGKHVRGAQSLARASHVSMLTKSQIQAQRSHSAAERAAADRAAIKTELDLIAAQLPPLAPERGSPG